MKPSKHNITYPYQFNKDYTVVYNGFHDTIGILTCREAEFIRTCDRKLGIHHTKVEDFIKKGFILNKNMEEPPVKKEEQEHGAEIANEYVLKRMGIEKENTIMELLDENLQCFLKAAAMMESPYHLAALGRKNGIELSAQDAVLLLKLMQPVGLVM